MENWRLVFALALWVLVFVNSNCSKTGIVLAAQLTAPVNSSSDPTTLSNASVKFVVVPPEDMNRMPDYNEASSTQPFESSPLSRGTKSSIEGTRNRVQRHLNGEMADQHSGNATVWAKPNKPGLSVTPVSTSAFNAVITTTNNADENLKYFASIDDKGEKECTIKGVNSRICKFTGLPLASKFSVKARACYGNPDIENCSNFTEVFGYTMPNSPEFATVTQSTSSSLTVEAQTPADDKGIHIYRAYATDDINVKCQKLEPNQIICNMIGLAAGTKYDVVVKACLEGAPTGFCGSSQAVAAWTRPNKPKNVAVNANSTDSVAVTFEAPVGSTEITNYEVFVDDMENGPLCKLRPTDEFICTKSGLPAGSVHIARVRALISTATPVVYSEDATASGYTKPNQPQAVTVVSESTTTVVVNFKAPEVDSGITGYEVTLVGQDPIKSCKLKKNEALTCAFPDLEAGLLYTAVVRAIIEEQLTPVVYSEDAMMSGSTKPDAPENVAVGKVSPRGVFVVWSRPKGNKDIEQFQAIARVLNGQAVRVNQYSCFVKAPFTKLECSIVDLNPKTEYSVSVRACMPGGTCGAEAGAVKVLTCEDSPNYVLIISLLVVFFVIIIIVVVLLFVCCRRRKSSHYVEEYDKNDFLSDLRTIVDVKQN